MGGIVARLMMLKSNHPKNSVDTIITLSSPHAYPPVPLDKGVEEVYTSINTRWREHANTTLLISLSGGILDNQLSSEPASLPLGRIWYRDTSLSAFTSSLAGLWSGVDHLAMMWCDQLRERIARGVLNIEGRERSIYQRREEWRRMLGIAIDHLDDQRITTFLSKDSHMESQESPTENQVSTTYKISDAIDRQQESFDLFTSHSVGLDTSFGPPIDQQADIRVELCTSDNVCRYILPSAYDLYPPATLDAQFPRAEERYEMPGKGIRRLTLSLKQMKTEMIDIIRIERIRDSSDANGFVDSGWTGQARYISIMPHFWKSAYIPFQLETLSTPPSKETIVSGIDSSLFAYDLYIVPSLAASKCKAGYPPMLKIQSLSTGDTQYYPGVQTGSRYVLTLHATSPYMPPAAVDSSATSFNLLLDTCAQIDGISIRINWKVSAGLLVSRYRAAMVAFPLAIIVLASGLVWNEYDRGGEWNEHIYSSLALFLNQYFTGDFASLTSTLVQRSTLLLPLLLTTSISLLMIQKSALQSYSSEGLPASLNNLSLGIPTSSLSFTLLLDVLFMTASYGIAILVSFAVDLMFRIIATLCKFMPQSREKVQNKDPFAPFRRPRATIISAILFSLLVWLAIPIQFVYLVLFLIQILSTTQSVCKSSQYHLEAHNQDHANQQKLLFNIFIRLLPFNAPALLIWTRNLLRGYFGLLSGSDHNILAVIGFLFITQISSSGQILHRSTSRQVSICKEKLLRVLMLIPHFHRICSMITLGLFAFVSGYALAYGIRYTYILFDFANIIMLWLALHQYYMQYKNGSQMERPRYTSARKESDEVEEATDTQIVAYSNLPSAIINSDTLPDTIQASLRSSKGYSIPSKRTGNSSRSNVQEIDILLERYLELLDDYFACKKQIAECSANGSFQLSKAKMQLGRLTSFNDMWDARMKASLVVQISPTGKGVQLIKRQIYQEDDDINDGIKADMNVLIEAKQEATTIRNRRVHTSPVEKVVPVEEKKEEKEKEKKDGGINAPVKKKAQPFDPLYQFAALPPPSLRNAQRQYFQMLETLIGTSSNTSLVQIQAEMNEIEIKIARLRGESS